MIILFILACTNTCQPSDLPIAIAPKFASALASLEQKKLPQSTVPLIIHIGHTIAQDNTRAQETHASMPITQNLPSHYFFETFKNNKPACLAGCVAIGIAFLLYSLEEAYQKLIDKDTWTGLVLHRFTPVETIELLSPYFIEQECNDRHIGCSPYGILRRSLQQTFAEEELLHSFCTLCKLARLCGIGFLFPRYTSLYRQQKTIKEMLDRISRTIASLMVSRYPSKQ